jgi:curli biogenesis system outer membrane secretion channel CsgG
VTTPGRGRGAAAAVLALLVFGSCAAAQTSNPSTGAARSDARAHAAPAPTQYLLVIDLLSYAAEALASDPIAGSPDAEALIPIIGDPTALGSDVTDLATAELDASTRCAVVERRTVEALAAALNARLPADQQIDPDADSSRSLLHWEAADGFASLRVLAQDRAGSPSCGDAGTRF